MITVYFSAQRAMAQAALKKELKQVFPERDEMNYVEIELSSTPSQEIAFECENLALGYDKKVVVGLNAYFLEKKSKVKPPKEEEEKYLLDYLKNPNPDVDLYLLVYADEIDQKGKYFPLLKEANARIVSVAAFTEQEWARYIPSYFKKRGIIIDGDAVYEFIARLRGDYALFLSEVEKLSSFAAESKHISKADIETMVVAPLEENAFLLSNALTRGNKKESLRIYENLKISSTDEIYLLNLLANQFRILNEIRYLKEEENRSAEEIASTLRVTPGRVRACFGNLRNMNEKTCPLALEGIYEAEKNILSGKMAGRLAFSLFVVNFKLRP